MGGGGWGGAHSHWDGGGEDGVVCEALESACIMIDDVAGVLTSDVIHCGRPSMVNTCKLCSFPLKLVSI